MESQPQNPEFRINPENFHPCIHNRNSHRKINTNGILYGILNYAIMYANMYIHLYVTVIFIT